MGINIRQARSEDRAAMDSISARTWGGDDYLSDVLDDWLADPNGHMYVAERSDDGKILGLVRLVCLGPDEWWLEGMRVDPDHYGEGIGGLLHQYSVEQAEVLGSGEVRLATSSLNKAVHKMCADKGFTNVGTYAVYRANAQPNARHTNEFYVLTADDLPAIRAFLERSAYYEQAGRSLEYSYKWYLITDSRLREWIGESRVYRWTMAGSFALDGLIILNPMPEVEPGSGRVPILEVGYLDARTGQLAPMAQAARELCSQLGYRKMQLRFVARGERLVAMEQAGWRVVRHTDNLFLFARRLKRE